MSLFELFLIALLGGGITYSLIPLILKLSQANPTATGLRELHHTHQKPVSRLGGIALIAAFLASAMIATIVFGAETYSLSVQAAMVLGAIAMFLLGLTDDLSPIGAHKKLLFQILIATAVYFLGVRIEVLKDPFSGGTIEIGLLSGFVTVLWLVVFTNLINLVDGADGLAGGISLMLMGLLAYTGMGREYISLIAVGMVGALLAFLRYNFPPARIYMGDGGAYFLGFLIGMLSIMTSHKGTVAAALIAPLFVLALPIVDTTLAILRRWLKGLPLFRPDRKHIHHRLAELGYSRRRVVLSVYGVTAVFMGMGMLAFWSQGRWVPILLGCLALTLFLCARMLSFSRQWFSVGRVLGNSLELRREVQYAITLIRWFELEGERADSVAALWQDFQMLTRKLHFGGVKVTLPSEQHEWTAAEFAATADEGQPEQRQFHTVQDCLLEITSNHGRVTEVDRELFSILSELAAEGWQKALRRWERCRQSPVRARAETARRSRKTLVPEEPEAVTK